MIPIYKPYFTQQNLKYAHDAIDSGWISSQGEYLDLTKNRLKEKLKYNNHKVILTNNGTSATHLLAIALKYKYPHIKKIIVPNNVYVAAWNSFLYTKDYELLAIDADLDTWNFDQSHIERLLDDQTAVLIVHNIGNIINVPNLKKQFPNTIFLEDNCEGFLGSYNGMPSGSDSLASSISFFGNKTITSGEGGAFITNDIELFDYINNVKNQGQSDIKFVHNNLGYNYRMTNVQAAILYGQLEDLDYIVQQKHKIFLSYKQMLSHIDRISFQKQEENTEHSNWMFGIRIRGLSTDNKNKLGLYLYESNIDTRPMFYDIHSHEYLRNINCDSTKNAQILQNECIMFPSYPTLTSGQISYICDKLISFLKKL